MRSEERLRSSPVGLCGQQRQTPGAANREVLVRCIGQAQGLLGAKTSFLFGGPVGFPIKKQQKVFRVFFVGKPVSGAKLLVFL